MTIPRNKWLILAVIWFFMGIYALIFRESSGGNAAPFPHFDKLAHVALFFIQTWLLAKIWLYDYQKPLFKILFTFGLFYAIGSELAQHWFTQTRQGDVLDICADMVGVGCALYLAKIKYQVQK